MTGLEIYQLVCAVLASVAAIAAVGFLAVASRYRREAERILTRSAERRRARAGRG